MPMQKLFLKIAPYLVLLIVFFIASSLLVWDIKISKSNTFIATFLMKEKGHSVLQTFESNIIASRVDSREKFNELLLSYTEQENVEFMAVADENGKILISSIEELIGKILPLKSPKALAADEKIYINPDIPFTSSQLHQAKYFIVQKHIFRSFAAENGMHQDMRHGMHKMKRRNTMICNKLERLGLMQSVSSSPGSLFLIIGFDIKEVMEAKILDDKKSLINLIAFTVLILLSILSFILLKKYQKFYQIIEESKVYFDGLMTTIPLGILTIDQNNVIVTANPVAENMLATKNLIGKNICDYIPSIAFMDFNRPVINSPVKLINSQNDSLELNSFSIILDNKRKGIGIILRDLKEIQKLQEELNRKDRLASIGQLAAGIAHEIRNPLSSIKGFARIFEENADEGSEEKTLAQIMNQEILRVDKVISDLLEISKPNSLSLRPVSLKKLVEQAQNSLILQAKENNIRFVNDIWIDEITLDHDRILQVLHNIFINAIEAMKSNTANTDAADGENAERGGTIYVKAWQEQDCALLSIQDTGQGIPQNMLSQLFTPYYTTKAKGTGLGLVIVQKIIEAHKGTIKVESKEHEGTTFTLSFPFHK